MVADVFGLIALIGLGMCVVFGVTAAVFAKKRHIREVREELTGRSALRAIEDLRSGRVSIALASSMPASRGDKPQSSPLQVRRMTKQAATVSQRLQTRSAATASEAATTTLGRTQYKGAPDASEDATSILNAKSSVPENSASEDKTTLL